ncbi:polysaccharide deacetylase family protein [Marinobacter sp. M216]|uniref:Polysaccharide deacetylase family protein n=1 Tax=Marinobacter albus TaxID=3030833 RepID=A0ABT7HBF8_9GAMM|nr:MULTISPECIES: polysaccharide deacetylase family protein [unclassified Marinobacter]MDK9557679.1 polysaccharide deacetylase family protein [Marinobacter sp. M216]
MAYLRSALKFLVIAALAVYGWLRVKLASEPILIILTYHRILPKHHPDREFEQPGMVTAPEVLRRHIHLMKSLGAIPIHLDEWLRLRASDRALPKLSVALTFDDGWKDNFQYAYPILKSENVPATVFLVTRLVDTNDVFWPEKVLKLLTSKPINEAGPEYQWLTPYLPNAQSNQSPLTLYQADQAINRLKSLDDATIMAHLSEASQRSPSSDASGDGRSILNRQELTEMASDDLVRYGAHTQHHFRLNRLDNPATLKREILGCLDDLNEFGTGIVPIFCYPNGDITAEGRKLVEDRYRAACTTKTGWNLGNRDPFDLHRFNLHDGNSGSARHLLATIGRGIL